MNHDEIVEKLKRIMRLARRAATDGERVAAESAAKRLADKAGVALESVEVTDSDIKTEKFDDSELIIHPGAELGFITGVLRNHFGIILVQSRARNSKKVKLSWIGTRINVEVAKHVFVFLLRECRKAWGEARMAKRMASGITYGDPAKQRQLVALRKLNKQSFLNGWFFVIHQKLTEHPLRNDVEQFAAEKKSAEDFLKSMPNIDAHESDNSAHNDRTSILLGIESAKKVNLNRPCDGHGYTGAPNELCVRQAIGLKH